MDRSSRTRLTEKLLPHFSGDTLFDAIARVARLRSAGYRVFTQLIPGDITPRNRLLLAGPEEGGVR